MRQSKKRYQLDEMIALDKQTVSSFTSMYLQKIGKTDSFITPIEYDAWKTLLEYDTISDWIAYFTNPEFAERAILIVGDYDVDGMMSAKIALYICQQCGAEVVDIYIPNRFIDGYGLNKTIVEYAQNEGYDTILTVDNGIAAHEAIEYAKTLGIDVLLSDHHHIQNEIPEATLVLHPDLGNVNHGSNICGSAVIFSLAYYLFPEESKKLLPYVMLATLADSMEMGYLNRSIVREGIQRMTQLHDPFILRLIQKLEIDIQSAKDLSWKLIPVLNAIGRLDDVNQYSEALFFLADDVEEEIETCIALNETRKAETEKIVKEVLSVEQCDEIICMRSLHWHQGVLGIAAARIAQMKHKPVILFAEKDGVCKGSGRSQGTFDLFAFLEEDKENLTAFGGHTQACGLTVTVEQYERLATRITEAAPIPMVPEMLHFSLEHLDKKDVALLYKQLQQLEPFGQGFEAPIFLQKATEKQLKQLGSEKQHIKYTLANQMQLLFFNEEDRWRLTEEVVVFGVGPLSINQWQDTITYQMIVQDWWIDEIELFYPNQVSAENSSQLYHVDKIPTSKEAFMKLQKEASQHGALLLNWQSDQQEIVAVNDEQLRQIYKFFMQRQEVVRNEAMYALFKRNRFEKKQVNFAIIVFLELEFVIIENEVIKINKNVIKKSLSDSKRYQMMQFQHRFMERVVYAPQTKIKQLFTYLEDE